MRHGFACTHGSRDNTKHGDSDPRRILQLLQGIMADGVHAVVDEGAAQKHAEGKDPQVVLRITLENM